MYYTAVKCNRKCHKRKQLPKANYPHIINTITDYNRFSRKQPYELRSEKVCRCHSKYTCQRSYKEIKSEYISYSMYIPRAPILRSVRYSTAEITEYETPKQPHQLIGSSYSCKLLFSQLSYHHSIRHTEADTDHILNNYRNCNRNHLLIKFRFLLCCKCVVCCLNIVHKNKTLLSSDISSFRL